MIKKYTVPHDVRGHGLRNR